MKERKNFSELVKIGNLALILALLGFVGLNLGSYLALTHRKIDAEVKLSSPPLPITADVSLHKSLSFRVAIANIITPLKAYQAYLGIANLLAQKSGLPLELLTTKSYGEINDLLRNGKVDLAFVGVGCLRKAPEAMDVIAREIVKGAPVYYALIIVPKESPAHSLLDLEGKKFLYTDPNSHTGYWYPVHQIKELGKDPDHFFSSVQWTQSHDRSIVAIAQKMADGASVSSVIYDLILKKDPSLAERVRILEQSEPFPSPPVVVRRNLPIKGRNLIIQTLVHLSETEQGRTLLNEIGVEGFTPATNSDYAIIPPGGESVEREK